MTTNLATSDDSSAPLAAGFQTGPVCLDAFAAEARLNGWLNDVAAHDRAALEALARRFPQARAILLGIAEASPYLFDLMRADAARLLRLLEADPEEHLAFLIDEAHRATAAANDEADVMRALRQMKAEASLLIALCDIGGVWPVMRVTQALTDIAVNGVRCALRYLFNQEVKRGRLVPPNPAEPEQDSGFIVLAMGKMGAGELNYSSDIDLIVFFDSAAPTLKDSVEPQPFFVRIAQGLSRILQQRNADGYVFRVDLRLRPDPSSTPLAISTASALDYYEREGRTWERAAMIKALPCAGDIKAGNALMADIAPFVWRKYLDFAALADVHDMKRQMHAYMGHNEIAVEGHNIKQGRGGIREIEFFAQTQQLIAGGRHPHLRVRPTLQALDILATDNWITFQARDELSEAYLFLRRVEHRLQMVADEQTHTLPEDNAALEQFARFLGYPDRDAFATELLAHLNRVQGHYSRLFEGEPVKGVAAPAIDYTAGPDDPRIVQHLVSLGFKQPAMVAETVREWLSGDYRALKAEGTLREFTALVPALLSSLARAENPDGTVAQFDRFLQALHRGARLMSLLHQNSDLVALIALVVGAAPRLGEMLARQPQMMDGLIDPRFFGAIPQRDEISQRLTAAVKDAESYEEFLDSLRMFGQESLFLIGSRILSGTVSAQVAGVAFADVAEGIVRAIHRLVTDQFAGQHGRIKDQETAIVAMGRLGSREMTASSDLDLITIYDFDAENPDSDGERSLQGGQYYARLTQRLISAFTTRTNYGVLYEVDMRLRPSGRSGPLATSIGSFSDYQDNEAWTWEHMALTRARVISASPAFQQRIEAIIRDVLTRPRDSKAVARDVLDMRRAIAMEKGEDDIWDLKNAAGGMIDVEFIAQYLQLACAAEKPDILDTRTLTVLENAARLGCLDQADATVLRAAMRLYQDLNQILRLCLSSAFKPDTAGSDLLRILTRAADEPDFSALEARLKDTQIEVRRIFERLLEAATSGE